VVTNKLDESKKVMEQIVQKDPKDAQSLINLGHIYRYVLAVILEILLQYCSLSLTIQLLIKLCRKQGDRAKALEYFIKGLRLDPNTVMLCPQVLELLEEQQRYKEAFEIAKVISKKLEFDEDKDSTQTTMVSNI
jgi:tetratricopeptide (TPR) repeat protein